jgi:hypothetical protein
LIGPDALDGLLLHTCPRPAFLAPPPCDRGRLIQWVLAVCSIAAILDRLHKKKIRKMIAKGNIEVDEVEEIFCTIRKCDARHEDRGGNHAWRRQR